MKAIYFGVEAQHVFFGAKDVISLSSIAELYDECVISNFDENGIILLRDGGYEAVELRGLKLRLPVINLEAYEKRAVVATSVGISSLSANSTALTFSIDPRYHACYYDGGYAVLDRAEFIPGFNNPSSSVASKTKIEVSVDGPSIIEINSVSGSITVTVTDTTEGAPAPSPWEPGRNPWLLQQEAEVEAARLEFLNDRS